MARGSVIVIRLIVAFLLFFGGPAMAWAAPASTAPVYNPSTKSYFQLVYDTRSSYVWDGAQREAATKVFKGARGRLAVVDSPETHQFLLDNFDIEHEKISVWIGLRYWCRVRMLQWEGERLYSPTEPGRFNAWHSPWHRYEGFCDGARTLMHGYMAIYYGTINGITRWQAVDIGKGFHYYFVEYPTGSE